MLRARRRWQSVVQRMKQCLRATSYASYAQNDQRHYAASAIRQHPEGTSRRQVSRLRRHNAVDLLYVKQRRSVNLRKTEGQQNDRK